MIKKTDAWYGRWFHIMSERFYQKTGLMAPGKAMPMEMWSIDIEERRNIEWIKFLKEEKYDDKE